jgi:hypothetical protein
MERTARDGDGVTSAPGPGLPAWRDNPRLAEVLGRDKER